MLDFPNSPTTGQVFNNQWAWDGVKWTALSPGTYVGDTAPTGVATGSLWWSSLSAQLFVLYADPNSTQWIQANSATADIAAGVAPAQNNVGRNLLHNSLFNVAQRGAGPWTTDSTYTLDRWGSGLAGSDAISITQAALSDADRTAIGDEAARSCFSNVFTGSAAGSSTNNVSQRIEDIRRLSNKTVMVSFWAKASTALKIGVSIDQFMGTGGSPSVDVIGNGTAITLTTSYARYTATFTLPSAAGKTTGTNGNSCHGVTFWFSGSSAFNARTGNIGVQSGTIQLWGVQLEIGSVVTPLEKPDPQQDLAKAQRFFCANLTFNVSGYGAAGTNAGYDQTLPVTMRGWPTVTPTTLGSSNMTALQVAATGPSTVRVAGSVTATGGVYYYGTFTASADL